MPRVGENDVEWIEDKVGSLRDHFRSRKTAENGGTMVMNRGMIK